MFQTTNQFWMMKYLTVHRKLLWFVSLVIVSRCLFVTLFGTVQWAGFPLNQSPFLLGEQTTSSDITHWLVV